MKLNKEEPVHTNRRFRIKSKITDKYITVQADVINPKLILF
jgi:hypothetical protein